jgi:4-amino-4-deoxy-L-arabinose transferase-like glycosyltransferase
VTKSIWLLAAVCAVTFFAGLGTTALWEPDEPRFAEATRQMLLRHDYVTPWFNERPRFEKPILLYWLQLPFFAALGPTEAAARIPSALAGLIAVLATFAIAREQVSARAGVLAGVALATTLRFVLYARQGLTDVPVTAAVACAIWAMTRALGVEGHRQRRFAYLAWVFVAAAVLLKGPVAFFAPIVWSLSALFSGGRRALAGTRPIAGAAIVAAIALPWFALMYAMHGKAFLDVALGYEVVARYLDEDFPGRDRGFFYFWGVWLGDALPWSLFALPAFGWAYARRKSMPEGEARTMRLAAIWFLAVLFLFSLSSYKLPHYILPAYPAMALALGVFFNAAAEGRVAASLWRAPAALAAVALAACTVLLWLLLSRAFELTLPDPSFVLPAVIGAGALATGVFLVLRGNRSLIVFSALAGTMVLCYGCLATFVASRELRRFQPIPALAAAARRVVAPDEPLAVAGNYGAPGLIFYARHPVRQLENQAALVEYLSAPGRRHVVLPESELEQVKPQLRRPLRVQAQAGVFSVRMRRLLESEPQRASRILLLVTAD